MDSQYIFLHMLQCPLFLDVLSLTLAVKEGLVLPVITSKTIESYASNAGIPKIFLHVFLLSSFPRDWRFAPLKLQHFKTFFLQIFF